MTIIRYIVVAVLALVAIWLIAPVTAGVFHSGMIYPLPVIALFVTLLLFPNIVVTALSHHKILLLTLTALTGAGLIIGGGISVRMLIAARAEPPDNATVIVLGCGLRDDRPGRMLSGRIEVALAYLKENPQSNVIASGGIGQNTNISEAEAIRRVLVANGIGEERIFLEENSTNTYQNLQFSARIIAEHNLDTNVAVASDGFHQYRAARHATQLELTTYALPSRTFFPLAAGYWFREVAAVLRLIVAGV